MLMSRNSRITPSRVDDHAARGGAPPWGNDRSHIPGSASSPRELDPWVGDGGGQTSHAARDGTARSDRGGTAELVVIPRRRNSQLPPLHDRSTGSSDEGAHGVPRGGVPADLSPAEAQECARADDEGVVGPKDEAGGGPPVPPATANRGEELGGDDGDEGDDPAVRLRAVERWERIRKLSRFLMAASRANEDIRTFGADAQHETFDWDKYYKDQSHAGRSWFIIPHDSLAKSAWDMLFFLALAYTALLVPYRACFGEVDDEGGAWIAIDLVVDIIFLLDIALEFVTSFVDANGATVREPKRIAVHYLRFWFWIDLAASLPFNYILPSTGLYNRFGRLARVGKIIRSVRLLRLVRLMKVRKMRSRISHLESKLGLRQGVWHVTKMVVLILLVAHVVGCIWHLLGELDETGDNWITAYGAQDAGPASRYLASIYWSIATLATVGFGDVVARTESELAFSAAIMLVAVTWNAVIVSTMTALLSSFNRRANYARRKRMQLDQFMSDTKLPDALRSRIRRHSEHVLAQQLRSYQSEAILDQLSASLRADVLVHMFGDVIDAIPFLRGKPRGFVANLVRVLRPVRVDSGDYIIAEGKVAEEMYFLTRGRATILRDGRPYRSIVDGCYVGEIGCLVSGVYTASIRALTPCELFAVSRHHIVDLLRHYPAIATEVLRVADRRAARLFLDAGEVEESKGSNISPSHLLAMRSGRGPAPGAAAQHAAHLMGYPHSAVPLLSGVGAAAPAPAPPGATAPIERAVSAASSGSGGGDVPTPLVPSARDDAAMGAAVVHDASPRHVASVAGARGAQAVLRRAASSTAPRGGGPAAPSVADDRFVVRRQQSSLLRERQRLGEAAPGDTVSLDGDEEGLGGATAEAQLRREALDARARATRDDKMLETRLAEEVEETEAALAAGVAAPPAASQPLGGAAAGVAPWLGPAESRRLLRRKSMDAVRMAASGSGVTPNLEQLRAETLSHNPPEQVVRDTLMRVAKMEDRLDRLCGAVEALTDLVRSQQYAPIE